MTDRRDTSAAGYKPIEALRECFDLWASGAWPDSNAEPNLAETMEHISGLIKEKQERDVVTGVVTGTFARIKVNGYDFIIMTADFEAGWSAYLVSVIPTGNDTQDSSVLTLIDSFDEFVEAQAACIAFTNRV